LNILVGQDTPRRTFEVVVLTHAQRPKKAHEPNNTQRQRKRHKINKDIHEDILPSAKAPEFSAACVDVKEKLRDGPARKALAITSIDEMDIAAAAISGVTWPAIASGAAIAL
jgi:hypothetical protein